MKKINFLVFILIIFVLTSCSSISSKNKDPEAMVYLYKNPSTEYIEYESISLSTKSTLVIYSVDRNNALIMMELGSYLITDEKITINAGKFQAVGIITDEKIVINNKEYVLY
jgi:hypothetical protein